MWFYFSCLYHTMCYLTYVVFPLKLERMEYKAKNAEKESELLKEQLEDSQKQLKEVCLSYLCESGSYLQYKFSFL